MFSLSFLPFFVSFLIVYLLTPLTIKFFKYFDWLEDPKLKQKKTGNATALYPVPRGGGLPIFLAISITSLIFLPLDSHLFPILLAALIALMVGLLDDIKDISPIFRLFINIFTALIVISAGIGISFISNPLSSVTGSVFDLSQPTLSFNFFGSRSISVIPVLFFIFKATKDNKNSIKHRYTKKKD